MQMDGVQRIEASREIVWAALKDPAVLRQCIPGCEAIEQLSPTEFKATVTIRVGTIKASFRGKVTLSDLVPLESYTISGSGSGGAAGFAQGSAKVRLDADGDACILYYSIDAAVGGKLALGARLLDSTAKKLAEMFFARLGEALAPADASATAEAEAPNDDNKKKGWFRSLWHSKPP